MVGVEPQGLGILGPGLVVPPLAEQGRSQVVVHSGIVGFQLQGLGIPGPGLVEPSLAGESHSQVDVRLGIGGVEPNRAGKLRLRLPRAGRS